MIKISSKLNYDICIDCEIKSTVEKFISDKNKYNRHIIITDDKLNSLYPDFEFDVKNLYKYVIPQGENSKSINQYYDIIRFLSSINVDRKDLIIAFGGGVVGDLSGFVASTYMRGIDYIQIPTTILAMVDSSIGSKTGINTDDGKNLIGSFYDPQAVFIDFKFLKTLPDVEFTNGLAEVLKASIIRDKNLFELLMTKDIRDEEVLKKVIKRSVEIKTEIVENDMKESNLRQLLNFGHTFGHAIEKLSDFTVKHGFGVSIGMAMISKAYYKMGIISKDIYDNINLLIEKYNLPKECSYSADELYFEVLKDKKSNGEMINLIYPKEIGNAEIHKVSKEELRKILNFACE